MIKRTAVKVSYQGETKRLKFQSYDGMVSQAKEVFSLDKVKFFYLDDENELISVSSQIDYQEALSIEPAPVKFVIADSAQDAMVQLQKQLNESQALNETLSCSLNQSMIIKAQAVREFEVDKKISHEIGVGSDKIIKHGQDVQTDVKELVTKDSVGVMTRGVKTSDMQISTCTETAVASNQTGVETKDFGCGQPAIKTVESGNQM